jgi:hypothetical protein
MAYRSDITINDRLLKNAIFSINDDSLTVQHDDLIAFALIPGTVIELGIVSLMMYPTASILAAQGNTIMVDLWAITRAKEAIREEQKRANFKKRGRKKIEQF